MNNSTKFILSAVAFSLLLLLGYEFFLRAIPTKWVIGQNQLQRNIIAAEQFAIAPQHSTVVLVGSSLSSRIGAYYTLTPPLPPLWQVLAFGGGTAFDGVEILRRTDYYPDTVLIEMNLPYTLVHNTTLLNAALATPAYPLKRYINSLRTQLQPSNVILQLPYMLFRSGMDVSRWDKQALVMPGEKNEATFAKSVASLIPQKRQIPADRPDAYLTALGQKIAMLRQHQCVVMLYLMPVDPLISAAMAHLHEREVIGRFAAQEQLPFIDLSGEQVTTTDGLHLDKASAGKIRSQLLQRIQAL